jgi:hypothetical protein
MFDRHDNLLLVNQTHPAILVFAAPYTKKAVATLPLKGTTVECAMSSRGDRLFCADYEFGSVDAYAYPTGKYLFSYTNGLEAQDGLTGIALQPPTVPADPPVRLP